MALDAALATTQHDSAVGARATSRRASLLGTQNPHVFNSLVSIGNVPNSDHSRLELTFGSDKQIKWRRDDPL